MNCEPPYQGNPVRKDGEEVIAEWTPESGDHNEVFLTVSWGWDSAHRSDQRCVSVSKASVDGTAAYGLLSGVSAGDHWMHSTLVERDEALALPYLPELWRVIDTVWDADARLRALDTWLHARPRQD